jgi:hypothetical protein
VQTSGPPAAMYLRVSGPDAICDHVSPVRIHQRLLGTRFDIGISAEHQYPAGEMVPCTAMARPFKVTVPLPVYGLAAGTYSYTVNGGFAGQFTLTEDNTFGDDCDPVKAGRCP